MSHGHMSGGEVMINNPHLRNNDDDVLYHFGFTRQKHDFVSMFGDVKFVCCCGSFARAHTLAVKVHEELASCLNLSPDDDVANLSLTDRYCLYKVGPILFGNHGMGVPSISIMLIEMLKMLHYAECKDVTFFRLGTCGGIGLEPGSVVVSKGVLNGALEPFHVQYIFGKQIKRPAKVDAALVEQLTHLNEKFDFHIAAGITLCSDDFYEGQGRLDGAFCEYSNDEKLRFLQSLYENGVRNVEMESICFFGMLHRAGVKAATLAVTLLDRLKGDQIDTPRHVLEEWEERPCNVLLAYLKHKLNNHKIIK